jgi:hypothetical protein
MAQQLPRRCFNPKQTASTPQTQFFSIVVQWQKPLTPQKNPLPTCPSFSANQIFGTSEILFAINRLDGAINGINSLIDWKKTAFAKSNSPQTHKQLYFH